MTNESAQYCSLTSAHRTLLTFWSLDPAEINGRRNKWGFECRWASPPFFWFFPVLDADSVCGPDGQRKRRRQRSGKRHASPRWMPERVFRRGPRILGLACPTAPDKHAAARRGHVAAVQRFQVQRTPEEQRKFLWRGSRATGKFQEQLFYFFRIALRCQGEVLLCQNRAVMIDSREINGPVPIWRCWTSFKCIQIMLQ